MSPRRRKRFQSLFPSIDDLPKRHTFFLNPYAEYRFTKCPKCDQPTKIRKRPFVIHIQPSITLNFNMPTRYCPDCDLIIMHQDILEHHLVEICELQGRLDIIGNDYLVMGTLDREIFHKVEKTGEFRLKYLYMFEEEVGVEVIPAHWGPADDET